MAKLITIVLLVCSLWAVSSALPRVHRKLHPSRIIVGGEEASQGQFPYQMSLRRSGSHICGGALLYVNGVQVVITAAHCAVHQIPSSFTVVGGDLKRSENSGLEQSRAVSRIIVHERYVEWEFSFDIAVLLLVSPFQLDGDVATIALPTQGQATTGDVIISGWGATGSEPLADHLHFVQVPIVDDAECQEAYPQENIRADMLCTGFLGLGGKDSCWGDNGGPVRSVDGHYLAGIVSWRYACAHPRYPSVNTEVSHFVTWLHQLV